VTLKKKMKSEASTKPDYDQATYDGAASEASLDRLHKKAVPDKWTKDKFDWQVKKRKAPSNVVDFRAPNINVRPFQSLQSAQNYISGAGAVYSGSASNFAKKKEGWMEADHEAAIQNSYQHLLKFWDEHPELKSLKIVDDEKSPKATPGVSHWAGIYKVTFHKNGVPGDGRSYYGQFVRNASSYSSALKAAQTRWQEHINSSRTKPKDIGFHYYLRKYGRTKKDLDAHFTFELIETCRISGDEVCTQKHTGLTRVTNPNAPCAAEKVNHIRGLDWANTREKQLISDAGGMMKNLDNPTTFNLTPGGQGDAKVMFMSMVLRSEFCFKRFLAVFNDFKEKKERIPVRADNNYMFQGENYNIGKLISNIRVKGAYVSGFPHHIEQLTDAGFQWNPHDDALLKFIRAISVYKREQGDTWNGTIPCMQGGKKIVVELDGNDYNLGSTLYNVVQSRQYLVRDPEQALSLLVAVGFKSTKLYNNYFADPDKIFYHAVSAEEAKKLLETATDSTASPSAAGGDEVEMMDASPTEAIGASEPGSSAEHAALPTVTPPPPGNGGEVVSGEAAATRFARSRGGKASESCTQAVSSLAL